MPPPSFISTKFIFPGEAIAALRAAVRLEPGNAAYRAELIDAWYKYGVQPAQPAMQIST